ncbi:NAD(P)-dependent oxidoreductase [Streptomyces sp. NPDC001787]|uniref:NAD-dependent epimerase/dehydratase family protein n=1 Tax=Streptomyces sp. NPDC001787 TaxID=3154523 RepID=UPI0033276E68
MTHPRRIDAAQRIAAKDPQGRIQVVTDPDPSGPPTALRTANPSWSCVGGDATHHVVFQDDILMADNFFAYAEEVAAAVPGEAVAFYEGWEGRNSGVVRLGALTGASWAYAIDEHVPSLALMLPAEAARGYARFAAEHGDGWPYDVVIQRYLKSLGIPVRIGVPSTVDHDDVPSLAGNSTHGWRRATFFGERTPATATGDCATFTVVPFYQYGESKCAVRYGAHWEYLETHRYLLREGLLARSDAGLAAADAPDLPERVRRQVWLTAFATGAVFDGLSAEDPDPAVADAVMNSLGPGGLCEEYTGAELLDMIPLIRRLALDAFASGRAAHRAVSEEPRAGEPDETAEVVVTGGDREFAGQLARLLRDAGVHAAHAERLDAQRYPNVTTVVSPGGPGDTAYPLTDLLADAEKLGVRRLVHIGSAAVYRGEPGGNHAEDLPLDRPLDASALARRQEEQACLNWGAETGAAVQILRAAELVGPHAPLDGVLAGWMLDAWTRRPMRLTDGRRHQILDHRDLADALAAVLARPASTAVYNVASAQFDETEFAELAALTARRTAWEQTPAQQPYAPVMDTGLITAETGWQPTAAVHDGARALAQWLACDTHDTLTPRPRRRGPVD